MRDLRELNKYRDHHFEKVILGYTPSDDHGKDFGVFMIPTTGSRKGLKVIASSGRIEMSKGWDHVSVSLKHRCPNWDEMCKIKDLFFYPNETCFQLHPAEGDYVNNHKFCLHLWNSIHQDMPLPPPGMVGDKSLGTLDTVDLDTVRKAQDKYTHSLMDK